ncbi:MAG: hypothetical protein K9L62_02085 [Vallitaleaceae bacterium]|nr:hypothetical protein [Vallitaleaceae bacterium]
MIGIGLNLEYKEFLNDELTRKLYELGESETNRKIAIAEADARYHMLTNDINIIQKQLNRLEGVS